MASLKEYEAAKYLKKPIAAVPKPVSLSADEISHVTIDLPSGEAIAEALDEFKVKVSNDYGDEVQIFPPEEP